MLCYNSEFHVHFLLVFTFVYLFFFSFVWNCLSYVGLQKPVYVPLLLARLYEGFYIFGYYLCFDVNAKCLMSGWIWLLKDKMFPLDLSERYMLTQNQLDRGAIYRLGQVSVGFLLSPKKMGMARYSGCNATWRVQAIWEKVGTLVQFITTDGAPTYLFNLSLFNAGAFHCKIYALVNTDPAIQQGCTACIALALSCTIVANPFKGRSFRSRNAFTL